MTTKTGNHVKKSANGQAAQGIARGHSQRIAQALAQILSNTYLIYVKTQNFHWNVEDERFHSLHKLFEDQYTELAAAVDLLAERIRMLKIKAPGSMQEFLKRTTLCEADNEVSGNEMIAELCRDREAISEEIRLHIEEATNLGDHGTADLLIQQLRQHEMAAWMLRSHL